MRVSSTICRSKAERLMTLSTSAVAVCCWRDSVRSFVRWRSSLSSRVFSMAITACLAKLLTSDASERSDLLAVDNNGANQLVFFDHRNGKHCPCACELGKLRSGCARRSIGITQLVVDIADLKCLLRRQRASERCFGVRADHWIAPSRFGKCWRCSRARVAALRDGLAQRGWDEGYADAPHTHRLLRARRERPHSRRAAEQRDEIAAFQLIELHSIPASQTRIVR